MMIDAEIEITCPHCYETYYEESCWREQRNLATCPECKGEFIFDIQTEITSTNEKKIPSCRFVNCEFEKFRDDKGQLRETCKHCEKSNIYPGV